MDEIDQEYMKNHCWICGRTNDELVPFLGKDATLKVVEDTFVWSGIHLCGVCNDVMLGTVVENDLVSAVELREMVDITILKYMAGIAKLIDRRYTEPISIRTIREEMKKNVEAKDEEEFFDPDAEETPMVPDDDDGFRIPLGLPRG